MLASINTGPTADRLADLGRQLSSNETGDIVHALTTGLGVDLSSLMAATGLGEQEIALRLALIAMTEAEQRIESARMPFQHRARAVKPCPPPAG